MQLYYYSAIFQAGGLVVALVEVTRKSYLASIVPVIVNAVLGEHQVVLDIVAFVPRGDFPRSRLGEKQRGKILASWVTRKMRTIAQFSIRDTEFPHSQQQQQQQHQPVELTDRTRTAASKAGSTTGAGSIRHPTLVETEDFGSLQEEPESFSQHQHHHRGQGGAEGSADEHYPVSGAGNWDPRSQTSQNGGVAEHYQPFSAADYDAADPNQQGQAGNARRESLAFGAHEYPPATASFMGGATTTAAAAAPSVDARYHDEYQPHPHPKPPAPRVFSDAGWSANGHEGPAASRGQEPRYNNNNNSNAPAGPYGQRTASGTHGGGRVDYGDMDDGGDWPEEAILYQRQQSQR